MNLATKAWISVPAACLLSLSYVRHAGAQTLPSEPAHVTIEALADHHNIASGETFRVALVERIQPGWHTYWINPGDAGQATKLSWTQPVGYRIDEVQWPVPRVFRSGPLVTYGYEGQMVLLQTVHAPRTLTSSRATLSVEAQWLVCQDICIPEHGVAQISLRQAPSATRLAPSPSMALFTAASEQLPRTSPWGTSLVVGKESAVLTVHGIARVLPPAAKMQYLPLTWGEIDNAAPQRAVRSGADLLLTLARGDLRSAPFETLDGVLLLGSGSAQFQGQGFLLHAAASPSSEPGAY